MRKVFIIATLIFTLLSGAFLWWQNGVLAVDRIDRTQKIFVVRKGQNVRDIAKSLKDEHLIRDPVVFFLLVVRGGLDKKIQAGDFRLSPSMTAQNIAETLTHGTLDVWVAVPEGYRAEEIAELLAEKTPTFTQTWRDVLNQHEGYLFPDTYLVPKDASVELVVSIMRKNFEQKFATLPPQKNKLTREEVVTIASLIEREAKFPEDRPLVASVILNRLAIGMKLDIDATVQYALGYQEDEKRWWKKHLTNKDLAIDSPYNTYRNLRLPPTPIANPGLASLRAVVNPVGTNYLYYVSDKNGRNHYAETIEQHRENIKKYGL